MDWAIFRLGYPSVACETDERVLEFVTSKGTEGEAKAWLAKHSAVAERYVILRLREGGQGAEGEEQPIEDATNPVCCPGCVELAVRLSAARAESDLREGLLQALTEEANRARLGGANIDVRTINAVYLALSIASPAVARTLAARELGEEQREVLEQVLQARSLRRHE